MNFPVGSLVRLAHGIGEVEVEGKPVGRRMWLSSVPKSSQPDGPVFWSTNVGIVVDVCYEAIKVMTSKGVVGWLHPNSLEVVQ